MSETLDPNELPEDDLLVEPQEATKETSETTVKMEEIKLQEQVIDFRDKYLRTLADSENLRKRLQKERHELVQYAVQGAILDFLSPIDHFENALKFAGQGSAEVQHWATGFQMILEQFKEALSNNGVTSFVSVGTPFDPHCHEAVEMIETSEFSPGSVIEESLRGYKMAEKIIRPARVKVAKASSLDEENEEQ
ncbi:MAG: nucleotide exchange factor GrpE [Parachlamydiaceae bacterium]|nr:nucleotide exchange factor GrpE [Parachlamydiaceae bacterium]